MMLSLKQYIETEPAFYRKLLKIAIPVILQSVITTGVNLLDTMMLGRLGETALSASSLSNQFISLFIFVVMGISMGASVLASRYWGAKDIPNLKKTMTIALRVSLIIALAFSVCNAFFPQGIIRFYIQEADVIEAGRGYLLWSTPTYVLFSLTTVSTNLLRSAGITHVSLIGAVTAFFVNVGANYAFIFGKFGCPAMGVNGAALGTVIARAVECLIVMGYFFHNRRLHYRPRDLFTPHRDLLGTFFRISVPVMLSDGLLGIGESVLAMIMGRIGSSFVAANAIANVFQHVSSIMISGLAYAGCFLIGNTLGEGQTEQAKRQGNTFLYVGLAFGLLGAILIECIKTPVINSYHITNETSLIAYQLMHAISLVVIFRAASFVLTKGVLRGGGDTAFLVVADLSTMWLMAIPLGALAGLVFKVSPFWIFVALHVDQIIKAVWCVFRLRSGKWIKSV